MPKLLRIILLAVTLGTVATGCMTFDARTPTEETAPMPSSTSSAASTETPFVQVTPSVEPSPTLEVTATEEATATETVEIKNGFEAINKNIDDYLNGTLDYWGPNREYMFVDKIGGEEVEIGRTIRQSVNIDDNIFDIVNTAAVMLGRVVDDREKIYVVLGSEKNGQRLVWLVQLGMADKNEYPHYSKIRLISLSESHPLYNTSYNGMNLIYPDEMAKWLNDSMNRPVEIRIFMDRNNEMDRSDCGQVIAENECDFYLSEYAQLHFSLLSNWLDTGENFNEVKNLDCVVTQLSQDSIENVKAPYSGEIFLPIIR